MNTPLLWEHNFQELPQSFNQCSPNFTIENPTIFITRKNANISHIVSSKSDVKEACGFDYKHFKIRLNYPMYYKYESDEKSLIFS